MLAAVLMTAALSSTSAATSTTAETIWIYAPRNRPFSWFEDRTVTAEVIALEERLAVDETLGDVLEEATSVRILRTGGQGAFESISIRGSEPDHTVVLIGDLPVAGTDRGAVDLSLLPLSAFSRVEVFRGAAPAWFDQGQIGGVIRLVPRTGDRLVQRYELGGGSFGGFFAGAEAADRTATVDDAHSSVGVTVSARVARRTNDFPFDDDGATPFAPEDDRRAERINAAFTQANGFVQGDWSRGPHRVDAFVLAVDRTRGEPGPGHRQAEFAERRRTQVLTTVGYTYEQSGVRVQAAVNGGWDRDRFDDRLGEIGLGREDTEDQFVGIAGRLAGRFDLFDFLQASVVTRARYDRYMPNNAFAVPGDQPSSRWTVAATAEARVYGQWGSTEFEARPSASVRITEASLVRLGVAEAAADSVEQVPTFRLGVSVSPAEWLSLQGSVATGARLPTVLELFGDRGNLVANPELRSERSLSGDVGFLARTRPRWLGEVFDLRAEGRFFVSAIDDLIRYRLTAQSTAVAENTASGRLLGVEGSMRAAWPPWVQTTGFVTWLEPTDESGRDLPFRPRWSGRGEVELATGPVWPMVFDDVRARFEVNHLGMSWFDPANLIPNRARTIASAAVTTLHLDGRLRVTAAVRGSVRRWGHRLSGLSFARTSDRRGVHMDRSAGLTTCGRSFSVSSDV